jgi:hypothetical protein
MKHAPPGWEPHSITQRFDGWVIDAENPDRIPARVAPTIVAAMPSVGNHNSVAAIKARMIARQNMHTRLIMRRRKIARILKRVP